MLLFDIEGDGYLEDVTKLWCIVTKDLSTDILTRYPSNYLEEGIKALKEAKTLVGHNIIGYDLPAIWKVTGEWDKVPLILDTLTLSRFLYPERPGGHSLEAWGETLGCPKGDFKDFHEYSEEMLEYCVQDVTVNELILRQLEVEFEHKFEEGFKIY